MSTDPRRWKALAVLCVASLFITLDSQIVTLALPSMKDDLGLSSDSMQWVLSGYLLSFGGLLLLGGRSADLLGARRVFMIGTFLFLVSSLLCGLAWSAGILLGARVVQGMSAALMAPSALSILMTTFTEPAERNKALAFWSGTMGFGATAALLAGGPITEFLGWPWIFLINIPVAAALLALSPRILRESKPSEGKRSFDPVGALTITVALVAAVFAIAEAPRRGWADPVTIGMLLGALALVGIFVLVERRSDAPLVPLRIFRSRSLVGGNLVMLLLGASAFGMALGASLYGQQVLGYSAVVFGLGFLPMTVVNIGGSALAQSMVAKFGVRAVAAAGLLLIGGGCLLLTTIAADGGYWSDLFVALVIFGPGLGACFVAASIAALSAVAPQESGLASGINTAAFQIGGAIGVAIVTSVSTSFATSPEPKVALTEGLRAGFGVVVLFALLGVVVTFTLLSRPRPAKIIPLEPTRSGER
ncbi:drug resistance transporter, EmrB/QacA subfamily [Amycolatopsis xylanica]|uniref:Drug resistance transporter, EmrB/QacA subfamily n=1 Tax=Amycolatopsis xylanica TaxID=589385 RepID=A0A1H3DTE1_9PSEU|nr:DHA2 family efflux MFS transporter permease subunit [Amycolatopsis xylanica]SDX69607.1 drug resistance transporter, EmrB/QacA subfamily [Amycolatopsis xylanica]